MEKVMLIKCPVCKQVMEISQFSFDLKGEVVLECDNCKIFVKWYEKYGVLGIGRKELEQTSLSFEKMIEISKASEKFEGFCKEIIIDKRYKGGCHV
ncbi:MAG TPA: hypothetical protein VMR41_03250 [Patescibacteria group bacterium]|jgi:hypothetical protein|nr:hypothetical protein [Patescibacteria group bacterium]